MNYFTKEKIKAVRNALKSISSVRIMVDSKKSDDEQMRTFFDRAKLWHVIKNIVSVLYIEKLEKKELFFCNETGEEYWVIKKTAPKEDSHVR